MAPSHHSKLQESSEKLQFLYHPAHHPKNPFLFATPCKFLNFLPQNRKMNKSLDYYEVNEDVITVVLGYLFG